MWARTTVRRIVTLPRDRRQALTFVSRLLQSCMAYQTPSLHLPVPLQTRCRIPAEYLGHEATGTVAGISSLGIIFHYIVILDTPHQFEGETHTAISVGGPQLMDETGAYAWRLTAQQAHDRALAEL